MTFSTRTPVFWLAVGLSLALVASAAFEWTLVDLLTVFLISPFQLAVWAGFGIAAAVSLIHLVLRRDLAPTAVCLLAFALASFVPWTPIALHVDFWLKRPAREQVVADVHAGLYTPNDRGLITVPFGLSAGGDEAELVPCGITTCVFFFTFRGILDNATGFMFVPDGVDPKGFEWFYTEPWQDNWHIASPM